MGSAALWERTGLGRSVESANLAVVCTVYAWHQWWRSRCTPGKDMFACASGLRAPSAHYFGLSPAVVAVLRCCTAGEFLIARSVI